MKIKVTIALLMGVSLFASNVSAQFTSTCSMSKDNLYIDVHHFGPGKVKFSDVEKAHQKDLAMQKKFGVHFL